MYTKDLSNRRTMVNVLTIFLTTSLIAIVANSLNGYGFHLYYSISRYVGLENWSSIMFGVGNIFVAFLMMGYLWQVGRKCNLKWYYFILIVIMALMILGLSACPIGRFDRIYDGQPGLISEIHQFCSRAMFATMLVVAAIWLASDEMSRRTRLASLVFVTFGAYYCYGYLNHVPWLMNVFLLIESSYLLGFMGLCVVLQRKPVVSRQENVKH